MSATLDTLRLAKRFREAGATEPLAETFADALRETQEGGLASLASKADLGTAKAELKTEMAEIRGELTLVKWMVGTMIVLVLAVFWQLFTIRSELTDIKAQTARLETSTQAAPPTP